MNSSSQSPLNSGRIRAGMAPDSWAKIRQLTLLKEVDSTNTAVLRLPGEQQHAHAILADRQVRGRGRRERSWHSPAGGNIYLSLGWWFKENRWPLSTLPLTAAIAVCTALSRAGLEGHGVKWPNDIMRNHRKLAGILVELQSAGSGPALAVVGVGLNVSMPQAREIESAKLIDRPWTDLASELPAGQADVSRNRLVSLLLEELIATLEHFESSGFEPLRNAWEELDLLQGTSTTLEHGGQLLNGIARGVDRHGGLLLDFGDTGIRAFHSGEVSIRRG